MSLKHGLGILCILLATILTGCTETKVAPPPDSCLTDSCGICDNDPTNDCVPDCEGKWGGEANLDCAGVCNGSSALDECATCDADPENDCVEDCLGEWGGSAILDCTGTCGGEALEDCVGVCNGASSVDNCGVCDDDSTNDCVEDCLGEWGGSATLDCNEVCNGPGHVDNCETCDDEPTNDCVEDCLGEWGGEAVKDCLGVCEGSAIEDCAGLCEGTAVTDCAGTCGGSANLDQCGVCDDSPDNDCEQDCALTWGGSATTDQCGTCDDDPENDCVEDCKGDFGGSAVFDCAGICGGEAIEDCLNICNGVAVPDCNAVCDGSSTTDQCGICDDDPENDCAEDCAGQWGGDKEKDCLGVCGGPAMKDCLGTCNGDAVFDCLDVCDGTASLDCFGECDGNASLDCDGQCGGSAVLDCDGVCNGPALLDCAGVCNGISELDCESVCDGPAVKDCADTCNGDAEPDCDGTCQGLATFDECGACDDDPNNNCELACEIADCASNAVCVPLGDGAFECDCTNGWGGTTCTECAPGHYGMDCTECPGGTETPCNDKGTCDDGLEGLGTCTCNEGVDGEDCNLCQAGYFGEGCLEACPKTEDGTCNGSGSGTCDDGPNGTGACTCYASWSGSACEAKCGDAEQNGDEECDPGTETDTCNTNCTHSQCGDTIVNASAGESCDDGGESVTCDADCTAAACGDGTTNATAGEFCDEASATNTCTEQCTPINFITPEDGYLQKWLTIGPYTGLTSTSECRPSEVDLLEPPLADGEVIGAPNKVSSELTWAANIDTNDLLDLASLYGATATVPREAYALTYVYAIGSRDLLLSTGTDDGTRLWLNGEVVGEVDHCPGDGPVENDFPVTLNSGWNRLLIKVYDQGGGWGLFLRFLELNLDGSVAGPAAGLTYSLYPTGCGPNRSGTLCEDCANGWGGSNCDSCTAGQCCLVSGQSECSNAVDLFSLDFSNPSAQATGSLNTTYDMAWYRVSIPPQDDPLGDRRNGSVSVDFGPDGNPDNSYKLEVFTEQCPLTNGIQNNNAIFSCGSTANAVYSTAEEAQAAARSGWTFEDDVVNADYETGCTEPQCTNGDGFDIDFKSENSTWPDDLYIRVKRTNDAVNCSNYTFTINVDCPNGFWGANCENQCEPCGSASVCNDGLDGDGHCICGGGWTGSNCDVCPEGYYGDGCLSCPFCVHGSCNQGVDGDGSCACAGGWTGELCDECPAGLYGEYCDQSCNGGAESPCNDRGTCNDGEWGDGSCNCDTGWGGEVCEVETMVEIPNGLFQFGSSNTMQSLDSFYIDLYPVSADDYLQCVNAGACSYTGDVGDHTRTYNNSKGTHPINFVDWTEASLYCAWKGSRLPSEEEWEKAARGTEGASYPWGSVAPTSNRANYAGNTGSTTSVNNYPNSKSPYGIFDAAGNVWEWTHTWYTDTQDFRVLRGGAFDSSESEISTFYRHYNGPSIQANNIGFRCAN